MRTIDLALKDLRQILHDRQALLFLLVMPIVFTFFFGFVFSKPAAATDNRLPVGVVNQDPDGVLTQALLAQLNASETIRPVSVDPPESAQIDSQIVKETLAAGLVIPAGFSAETLKGSNPRLEMIINEETQNGQTVRRALQTSINRTMGMAQTAQSSLRAYERKSPLADDAARQAYLIDAVNRADQAWQKAPLSIQSVSASKEEDGPMGSNPYNQFSPGMMVMFAIFGLTQASMVMVTERRIGAMARLLTTPMNKAELIGGHILGLFIVFFAQQVILVLFGQLVLKVDYLRQPAATLLVMVGLSLWVASLGLLISTLSKKEDQVVLYGMIAMFLFSALGGAWFSLEMVGKAFSTVGHLTPAAWAIDGFQNILTRGLGFESVLLPVGILLAYCAAFFGLAIWKFKFE